MANHNQADAVDELDGRIPDECEITQLERDGGTTRVRYVGVSKQQMESFGWTHVESTDWFGVAELEGSE